MLGLIYIFATAKPISIRRLSLLFVLVLISASLVLRVLHVRTPGGALLSATLVTLFAWSAPLLHILHATLSRRALSCDALRQVSGFVRWTYGFAIAAVPIVTVSAILNPTRGIHLALPRLLVTAAIVALLSTMFIPRMRLPRSRGQAGHWWTLLRQAESIHGTGPASESKTVAPHIVYPSETENRQGSGIIVIPAGSIVSVEVLPTCPSYGAGGRSSRSRVRGRRGSV